jgi:hypothetical protein
MSSGIIIVSSFHNAAKHRDAQAAIASAVRVHCRSISLRWTLNPEDHRRLPRECVVVRVELFTLSGTFEFLLPLH